MGGDVPTSAKALKFDKAGQPLEALQLVDVPVKECSGSEVTIKLLAAPVNPSDNMTVQGLYPLQPPDGVGGHEGVGEVVAVGSGVKKLKLGDRVVPLGSGMGTWRTYGTYDESKWFKINEKVTLHDAATMLINPGTAMLMLEEFVDLKEGDVVIQNGGNSEVGKYVMSIARQKGAKTINIVRDRPNWDEMVQSLKKLGADLVATPETVKDKAKEAGLEPVLGLNCVGGDVANTMADMLQTSGTLVTYGAMTFEPIQTTAVQYIFKDLRLRGFWLSKFSGAAQSKEGMAKMLTRVQDLILGSHIASECQEIKLEDWKTAFGKIDKKALLVMK